MMMMMAWNLRVSCTRIAQWLAGLCC